MMRAEILAEKGGQEGFGPRRIKPSDIDYIHSE